MIETCRRIFKSFNVNNLSVCIGWCADQVKLVAIFFLLIVYTRVPTPLRNQLVSLKPTAYLQGDKRTATVVM